MQARLRFCLFVVLVLCSLLLSGCILEGEAPLFKAKEKPFALNVFAEKVPDITGSYVTPDEHGNKNVLRFKKVEASANEFILELSGSKPFETAQVLVIPLQEEGTLLLQIAAASKGQQKVFFLPARFTTDSLTLYPIMNKRKDAWDDSAWKQAVAKHGVALDGQQGQRLAANAKPETVKAAFIDMFAANTLGRGERLVTEAQYQAALAEKEKVERFMALCANGSLAAIKQAVQEGANTKAVHEAGQTLLMVVAADNPNLDVLEYFLEQGIDVNARSAAGETALLLAARRSKPEAVAALLAAGANLAQVDSGGGTALWLAARHNANPAMVQVLAKAGISPNQPNTNGVTPLMAALGNPQREAVMAGLLAAGADPEATTPQQGSLLLYGMEQRLSLEVLQSLVNPKTVNVQDSKGNTSLLRALESHNGEMVQRLLEAGADASIKNSEGVSPMQLALNNYDEAFALQLVQAQAAINRASDVVNVQDRQGNTLLMRLAGRSADMKLMASLVGMGADLTLKNRQGESTFTLFKNNWQVEKRHTFLINSIPYITNATMLEGFFKAGANVNEASESGFTPLMAAASLKKSQGLAERLLQAGAQADVRDKEGWSALHFAARYGTAQTVNALLAKGVAVDVRTEKNYTPLMLAAGNNDLAVVHALLQAGANPTAQGEKGWTPIMFAASKAKDPQVLEALLAKGASLASGFEDNGTALHVAARNNPQAAIVQYLLGKKLSAMTTTKEGFTPVAYAVENSNPEVLTLLLQASAGTTLEASQVNPLMWAAEKATTPAVIKALVFAGYDMNRTNKYDLTPLMIAANDNENPEITGMLLTLGADGRIKGRSGRTAFEHASYTLKKHQVYWQLKDAQFNEPKALTPELQAEKEAYRQLLQQPVKAQAAKPEPAKAEVATPEPVKPEPAKAEAVKPEPVKPESATTYAPLVYTNKPVAAAHWQGVQAGAAHVALQVLAPQKNIVAVRIDNIGGDSVLWRTDGKEHAAPLEVLKTGTVQPEANGSLSIACGTEEVLLQLIISGKKVFTSGQKFRVTLFLENDERVMALLQVP